MLLVCSHSYGIPSIWKSREIVVDPIYNIFIIPMIHVEHQASVGNFCKHYNRVPFMKPMFGWKKWLSLINVHFVQVAAVNLRKLFRFPWNRPKSVMHVRSILWFGRLITSIPYVFPSTPSHWLICSRRRSFFIRANHDLCKDFDILDDGSPSGLSSVLL